MHVLAALSRPSVAAKTYYAAGLVRICRNRIDVRLLMKTVAILGEDQIRIGSRTFRLTRFDPPLPNHSTLSVEAAGKPFSEYQEKFRLDDMRGVFAADFPADFSMSVYEPNVGYNAIGYMVLRKIGQTPESLTSLQHYYQDWTHPANLHHFYKNLAERLKTSLPDCVNIDINADDVSVSLWATCEISGKDDLFSHISKVAHIMESELRALAVDEHSKSSALGEPRHKKKLVDLKPDEDGYKWWLRYILIPLSAAAIGALIVTLVK